ncbi:MAG: histone-like nucleoid-structuring protein Lsr2 [Propionibacteriaceae bacterium]
MAQRVQIILEDDLDGGNADETVKFALDGTEYEIDLSKKNAAAMRKALAPYTASARKMSGRRRRGSATKGASDAATIRAWATDNGYEVSSRGRIPADLREAYAAATGR